MDAPTFSRAKSRITNSADAFVPGGCVECDGICPKQMNFLSRSHSLCIYPGAWCLCKMCVNSCVWAKPSNYPS